MNVCELMKLLLESSLHTESSTLCTGVVLRDLHEILLYGSQLVDGRVVILDTTKARKRNQPDSKPKHSGCDI